MSFALRFAMIALGAHPGRSLLGALAIALVVIVVTLLTVLANAVERSVVATADPRNALVLAAGAAGEAASVLSLETARQVREQPGVLRDDASEPLASAELVMEVLVYAPPDDRPRSAVLRGVEPSSFRLHDRLRLRAGRWPHRGARELALGRELRQRLGSLPLGAALELGRGSWSVVGVFDAPGTRYAEEAWSDLDALAADASRSGSVSLVRVRAISEDSLQVLAERLAGRGGAPLEVVREVEFQRRQAQSAGVLRAMVALVSALAGGAAAAGLATIFYASVEARRRELGVLRALGFRRSWVVGAVQAEALLVATFGLGLGIGAASLAVLFADAGARGILSGSGGASLLPSSAAWDGIGLSSWAPLRIHVSEIAPGAMTAVAIGLLAASGPAWRAARVRPAEILRAA